MVRRRKFLALGLSLCLTALACGSDDDAAGAAGGPSADAGAEDANDAAQPPFDAADAGDAAQEAEAPTSVEITVYHTSDEHGWLQPSVSEGMVYGGAANVLASLQADGFDPSEDLLVSSGDNWTGPAISTLFQGKPMVEAFNAMGYAASAIGNHEFDFGLDVLAQRVAESNYVYLGANLYEESSGQRATFAVPYTIVPLQGIDVGLIGITTTATLTSVAPKNIDGIDIRDVTSTLSEVVPEVRAQGAEVVLVLAHQSAVTMPFLASSLTEPVDAIFTGHDHGSEFQVVAGIPIIGSGWGWQGYTVTRFQHDLTTGQTTFVDSSYESVSYPESGTNPVDPDPGLLALVDGWQQQLDVELGEEIGYSGTGIPMSSWQLGNWVTDAWLWAYPDADIALQNFGGLRQSVEAGPITVEDLFGVMPFENMIYELELTGAQVRDDLSMATIGCGDLGGCYTAVSGVTFSGEGPAIQVRLPNGDPIDLQATYRVLVNDYMYETGPYPLKTQDDTPIDLAANYRDPVIAWTRQLGTSPSDPLEAHIDAAPRNE